MGIHPFVFCGFPPEIAGFARAVTRDASARAGNHASYFPALTMVHVVTTIRSPEPVPGDREEEAAGAGTKPERYGDASRSSS